MGERRKISRREYERRKRERMRKLRIKRAVVLGIMALILVLFIVLVVAGIRALIPDKKETKAVKTETKVEKPVEITISAAGDCTLGTDENFDQSESLPAYYDKNGGAYFLQNVKSIFEADDLTMVNMEGTLTTAEERAEKEYAFKGDPSYTEILTSGSVEAANVANNHSHDYGNQGFDDTLDNLKKANITSFGYEDSAVIDVKGVKVGLIGITQVSSTEEEALAMLKSDMKGVKKKGATLIIVNFHWGIEREEMPEETQKNLAHAAIDEGASLVIGHHPHVLQGIETYKGRYICYSLGNFCFGGNSDPSDYDTVIYQQTFTVTGDKVALDDNHQVIPCSLSSSTDYNNYQPTLLEGTEKERVQNKIDERSAGLGESSSSSDSGSSDSSSSDDDSSSSSET